MLRSLFHLREVLHKLPEASRKDEDLHSTLHDVLPQSKRLKAGRYHWMKMQRNIQRAIPQRLATTNKLVDTFFHQRSLQSSAVDETIRLLDILPGLPDDPIRCEIQYVSLQNDPSYEALSYCWENQTPAIPIQCDGMLLHISQNLSDAIRSLRSSTHNLLLWADAICIDQQNIAEKNQQLLLMRSIYQKAGTVQIWLGSDLPPNTSREAFALAEELYFAYTRFGWDFNIWDPTLNSNALGRCWIPALSEPVWNSLLEMIGTPWFTRVWIIQEVVLAKNAFLHCGDLKIEWHQFCYGFLFAINSGLMTLQPTAALNNQAFQHVVTLLITYICFTEKGFGSLDLQSLLQNHHFSGASDPKDKVYALLGLVQGQYDIKPDYSLSTVEIYTEASKAILVQTQSLDFLGTPRTRSDAYQDRLPSWAVDWTAPSLASSLSSRNLTDGYLFDFNASLDSSALAFSSGPNALGLDGYVFDKISRVGMVHNPFQSSANAAENASIALRLGHTLAVIHDWHDVSECFSSARKYPNSSSSPYEMFCRTMYYDTFAEAYSVDNAMRDLGSSRYARVIWTLISAVLASPIARKGLTWWESVHTPRALMRVRDMDVSSTDVGDLLARTIGRRFIVTEGGYYGLAPEIAETGHHVCLVKGSRAPLVLKRLNNSNWNLIGDCYVQGIMHGEAFEEEKCSLMNIE